MPVSVQISVDASEAMAMLQAGAGGLQAAIEQALQKAGDQVRDAARELAPVKTGHLRDSIIAEAGGMSVTITAGASYAKYVEFGRGPVRPVAAKALHWEGEGGEIFVMHAGSAAPHPFMRPAAAQAASIVGPILAEAVAQAFGE